MYVYIYIYTPVLIIFGFHGAVLRPHPEMVLGGVLSVYAARAERAGRKRAAFWDAESHPACDPWDGMDGLGMGRGSPLHPGHP